MNTPSPRSLRRRPAFTLVELLVVMGIIGLLVALLFPAIGAARQAANKTKAQAEVNAIDSAMRAYLAEYGKFPLQTSAASDNKYTNTTDSLGIVYMSLRGGTNWNPRKIAFMEIPDASLVDGIFMDPWDNYYRIAADWTMDRMVTNTATEGHGNLTGRVVAAWSYGSTGSATNRPNHIKSW